MPFSTILTPIKVVDSVTVKTISTTQILYNWRRTDTTTSSGATQTGGNVRVFTNAGDFTSIFPVGASVLWRQGGQPGYPENNITTVISSTFNATNTEVVVDVAFNGTFGSGWLNSLSEKPGYRFEFVILDRTGTIELSSVQTAVPSSTAVSATDIGSLCMVIINIAESNFLSLILAVREHWTGKGSVDSFTNEIGIDALPSTRQILKTGGGAMHEYIFDRVEKGKFLNVFETGSFWFDWRARVEYVIDVDYITRVVNDSNVRYTEMDINRQAILLVRNTFPGTLNPQIVAADLDITGLDTKAKFIQAKVMATAGPEENISSVQFFNLKSECRAPIMLEWINSVGGSSNWLFEIRQVVDNIPDGGLVWEAPTIGDLSTNTGQKSREVSVETQQMTLFSDNLLFEEIQALREIKSSDVVYAWLSKDATTKVKVIVTSNFETPFDTKDVGHDFNCTIEFPDNFDFFKGKLY